ncbi:MULTISPECIES: hypothetical protein [Pasteurellaceae]|uniref:Uncharacterized protein n=1 Tax=Pasteurella atlantica TaxID=2827233 RepID=A0AAW8CK30_9PAST|nr:hypothetical protein [Pasteurella atlantica]MBR0574459.1 hypothetical protein [Pasteurella atlantica]MDP8039336.1 hypothetical protein [Pasteurella atlantica]MDP8041428.1 hypothetical protein [Pasteurella atlantica]MDP8043647.1 hypothetical protein [Pasteurella atlantica]MDP8045649.1 hypothetical protein [Pasteurella atlantica]
MKFLTSSSKIKPLKQQLNKNKGSLQYHLFIKYKDKKFTSYLGDAYATNIVKKGDRIQYLQNDIESLLNNHDTVASFLLPYKPNTPKTNRISK